MERPGGGDNGGGGGNGNGGGGGGGNGNGGGGGNGNGGGSGTATATPTAGGGAATSAMYAAAAGVVAVAVTHPLDTWVVYQQTGRRLPSVRASPGVLFRGLPPALVQASIIYGAMLGSYEWLRGEHGVSVVAAAALSAIPESMVKGPLEAVKNMRQTQQCLPRLPSVAALRLAGVGFAACLARELPGNIAYFYSYEEARRRGWGTVVAGAAAATGFALCSYPFEVLRAQLVTGAKREWTLRGMGPYLLRGIAVTSCLFTAYEAFNVETTLGKRNDGGGGAGWSGGV